MTLEYLEIMEDMNQVKSDIRRELYNLTSKIDKCFVINEASVCQLK